MKASYLILSFGTILALNLASSAEAALELPWFTIDGGGGMASAGGAFELSGTIGQADAGPGATGMSGGDWQLIGGFWTAGLGVACEGDANSDGSVDPLDAGFVLARFGCDLGSGDPDCDAADQNGDGNVDPLDVGYVLARFGLCS